MWTRIISVYGDTIDQIRPYATATDLLMTAGFQPMPLGDNEVPWRLHFYPKDFVVKNPDLVLDNYRIGVKQLKDYGNHISEV